MIPRLNASIAFPCLVLNVYRILVSTLQSILFRGPADCRCRWARRLQLRRAPDRGIPPISRSSEWRRPSSLQRASPHHMFRERYAVVAKCPRPADRDPSTTCGRRCRHIGKPRRLDDFPYRRRIPEFRNYRAKPHICSLSVFLLPPTPTYSPGLIHNARHHHHHHPCRRRRRCVPHVFIRAKNFWTCVWRQRESGRLFTVFVLYDNINMHIYNNCLQYCCCF